MRHRFGSRALGALVALSLLGVAGGVSDVDALLFHPEGRPAAVSVPHAESASGAACHADRCTLALVLANQGMASAVWAPAHGSAAPQRAAAATPCGAPPRSRPHRDLQPRAPPPLA